jgi:peptidoglycan/xylan/chitin deacetylase (PgdA/CDA1 family)
VSREGELGPIDSCPNPGEPVFSLTFDDGPSPWTSSILDLLGAHEARATFFLLGSQIEGREEILVRTAREGHELASHGWSHRRLTELPDEEVEQELLATRAAIEEVTGVRTDLWRPPYLEADERVRRLLAELGLTEIGCSIVPEDYRRPAGETASYVLDRLAPGAIVDLHDGRPPSSRTIPTREPTVTALELILERAGELGYRSLTVSALLARGA